MYIVLLALSIETTKTTVHFQTSLYLTSLNFELKKARGGLIQLHLTLKTPQSNRTFLQNIVS